MKGHQLLSLGGVCQRLPFLWEQLVLNHLGQAQEVGKVHPLQFWDYLVFCMISRPRILFHISMKLYLHLPNVRGYQRSLHTLQLRVVHGKLIGENVVLVLEKVTGHESPLDSKTYSQDTIAKRNPKVSRLVIKNSLTVIFL